MDTTTDQKLDDVTEVWHELVHHITATAVALLQGSNAIEAFDGVMNTLPKLHNHFASGGEAPRPDFMDLDGPDLPVTEVPVNLPDFLKELLGERLGRTTDLGGLTIIEVRSSRKDVPSDDEG